ncbi:polyadenylation and cleavage factor 11-like protein, partial [Trifolium pratense]
MIVVPSRASYSWQNTDEVEFDWSDMLHGVNNKNLHQLPKFQVFPSQHPAAAVASQGHARPVTPQFFPSQDTAAAAVRYGASISQSLNFPPACGSHAPMLPRPNPPFVSSHAPILPRPNPPFVSSQHPPAVGYSDLINSLMAQGVISLANQTPTQDFVGIEFDPNILKVRHESVVSALY